MEQWTRVDPGPRDTLGAGAAALITAGVVGAVAFYLTRIFLAREPLSPRPPGKRGRGEG